MHSLDVSYPDPRIPLNVLLEGIWFHIMWYVVYKVLVLYVFSRGRGAGRLIFFFSVRYHDTHIFRKNKHLKKKNFITARLYSYPELKYVPRVNINYSGANCTKLARYMFSNPYLKVVWSQPSVFRIVSAGFRHSSWGWGRWEVGWSHLIVINDGTHGKCKEKWKRRSLWRERGLVTVR